jgi:hypothetical protein
MAMKHVVLATLAAGLLAATPAAAERPPATPDAVVAWNRTLLHIVRTPGAQPPTIHSTRSFALLHMAILDAVSAPPGASRAAAATVAAHDVLASLYPAMQVTLDDQEQRELAAVHSDNARTRGAQAGAAAAARVLALRAADGANATPPAYASTGLPGDYRPTPPAFAAPVFTHWGAVRPWVLRSGDQFRPPPPPPLSSDRYADAIAEVRSLGQDSSTTRTADQTQIARFWAAPIQNYWNEIAQTAALAHHGGLERDARLFAELNVSIADGAIAFYDAKYAYRLWRPITAIRETGDPAWTPLATTPADPSYPGAHSVVSAAASVVLRAAFGDDFGFSVSSEALPGVTRSFPSFSAAVDEAGRSRIYAGVHSALDDAPGRELGRRVAGYVLAHPLGASG